MIQVEFVSDFDSRVKNALIRSGFKSGDVLCAGVSGGADSISMITSLVHIAKSMYEKEKTKQKILVLTVDHRIRPSDESYGDALYVKNYCDGLNCAEVEVGTEIIQLKEGEVFDEEKKRKCGTEEAARFLRYREFEKNLLKKFPDKKIYFALAHNKNDQTETLVMRFLQGASNMSRAGIRFIRTQKLSDKSSVNYFRPLLEIDRNEIEKYLNVQNILWRTDLTNCDNNYLRNKIRNVVIPVLDKNFPGWKNAVVSGAKKAFDEEEYFEKKAEDFSWNKIEPSSLESALDGIFISKEKFYALEKVFRVKMLYKGFSLVSENTRIPYSFVEQIADGGFSGKVNKCGLEAFIEGENLFIKKIKNKATDCGFFAIIEDIQKVEFDFGTLYTVKSDEDGFSEIQFVTNDQKFYFINKVKLPFCFRSRQLDDKIATSDGKLKSVSDVLSDFKIDSEIKNMIPVIEVLDTNVIRAVWGEIFGFKNWIVER